jgi:predicted phosphate transport protein (TIGR00153 family)
MMFKLIPQEVKFFEMFVKSAENLLRGAKVLVEIANNFDTLAENAAKLERLEHDSDQITHEIMEKLNKTFVTPLDREDIHELTAALDDVMDFIEAATERMVLYKVTSSTPEMKEIAEVILKQAEEINYVMPKIKEIKHAQIIGHCIEINRLENEGDRILREAVAGLFDRKTDPLEVIKWRDIYDYLETATDKCEDIAVTIEGIALKYS